MTEPLSNIQAALKRLSRRERAMIFLRAVIGAGGAWCGSWALVAYAVNERIATREHGMAWLALLAAAGLVAGGWPLRRWRGARDARRQAHRVEELRPELRGALLAALDRAARPMGSPALLARSMQRVAPVVAEVPVALVHPASPVWRAARFAALGALLLAASALLDRGPLDALSVLWTDAHAETMAPPVVQDGPRALVGDLTLKYLYPVYTQLEPLEIPNSNGEVHAPPGTRVEVRARTAEVYPEAKLRVYADEPVPIELVDGRSLSAAFTVAGPGIYRFEFGELPSPDYRIVPDPDLVPDVAVASGRRSLEAGVDEPLGLKWTARDDYGVVRVQVEVRKAGKARLFDLRTLLDPTREVQGDVALRPSDLGLGDGDSASIRIAAWDNDAVSGSKPGYSAAIKVEVTGPRGSSDRHARYRRQIRDALVLVLADFLVEPSPPVRTGSAGSVWVQQADARYAAFDALVHQAWQGAESNTFDATLIRVLRESRRNLFAFTRSVAAGGQIGARDVETLVGLQASHVEALENAILMLDQVVRSQALAAVAKLAESVASEAEELSAEFDELSAAEALSRLDQLKRLYDQLAREAAKLDEGGLKDFLNDRSSQVKSLMDEIRKAIAEGRMDDAEALMERLAEQMKQMAEDMAAMEQRRSEEGDKLTEAMDDMQKELESLEKDQTALRERTEAAREKFGGDIDEAVKAWEEVEKLAGTVVRGVGELEGSLRPLVEADYGTKAAMEDAHAEADGLFDSARARDLETAVDRASRARDAVRWLQSRLGAVQKRGGARAGGAEAGGAEAGGADVAGALGALARHDASLKEIQRLLDGMRDQQTATSPALQRELQGLAEEQQKVAERAGQAATRAGRLGESLPMDAPGLKEGTESAAKQGQRAADAMRDGEPMEAEGAGRAAEAGLQEAQQALKEARRNLKDMQQAASSGKKDGEKGDTDGSGDGDAVGEDMVLPAPEAFQTPEEYRKALLEGMEGTMPEEYKTLNRRYYEELVRQ